MQTPEATPTCAAADFAQMADATHATAVTKQPNAYRVLYFLARTMYTVRMNCAPVKADATAAAVAKTGKDACPSAALLVLKMLAQCVNLPKQSNADTAMMAVQAMLAYIHRLNPNSSAVEKIFLGMASAVHGAAWRRVREAYQL
jgi:hypothetical protein